MKRNIKILLEHVSHTKYIDEEKEQVLIIPKNPEAVATAEISSKDTTFVILKYNLVLLKGQIEEKRRLLRDIVHEYEPILNKPP